MSVIVFVFMLIHVFFFIYLRYLWRIIPESSASSDDAQLISFSILIAFRNEEFRIQPLLDSLSKVDYKGDWEVIFIDDNSTDRSEVVIRDFITQAPQIKANLITAKKEGKKNALTDGINFSQYEYILTIDSDCTFNKGLLSQYNKYFLNGDVFVAGPVKMSAMNFFQKLQSIEFAGLSSAGAILLVVGKPLYCNGANMAYKKSAFREVNGYSDNEHIASGDDQFLLQKISQRFPAKVGYLKSNEAIVITQAETSIGRLVNQRIRWSSKWKNFKSFKMIFGSILFFMSYSAVPILLALVLFIKIDVTLALLGVTAKFLVEYLFIHRLNSFFDLKSYTFSVLALQIIYPIFIIFLAIASIFGSYSWKGRFYD